MAVRRYRFDNFSVDPNERRLFAGEVPVELNSRYFDALLLLLRCPGTLLSKERFLKEVWHGTPVTTKSSRSASRPCAGNSATGRHSRT